MNFQSIHFQENLEKNQYLSLILIFKFNLN